MVTEKKVPGQRYTHGPSNIEPFICQVEDYDLFLSIQKKAKYPGKDYFVLRLGDHANYKTQIVLLGYIKQPDADADAPWELDEGMAGEPRILSGRGKIALNEVSRLLIAGVDAINIHFDLGESVRLGDALDRLKL